MAKKRKKTDKISKFGDEESAAADGSKATLAQKDPKEEEGALPEAVFPPEEEKAPAEEKPYTVDQWGGFTQWQCKLCPWDTLEGEAAMLEHLASAHAPPPKPKSPILIADKSGRQVN
jgi:hypothetical protein